MTANQLNTIKKNFTLLKKTVYLSSNRDHRTHNSATASLRTDDNIKDRIKEFHDQLGEKTYYRIPLKIFTELDAQNT